MAKTMTARKLDPEVALQCLVGMDVGLLLIGARGEIRYMNPRAGEILEVHAEDVVDASVCDLLGLSQQGPLGSEGQVWRTFSMPHTQILAKHGEKELTLECRVFPLRSRSQGDGGVLLLEDISESAEELEFQRNIDRFSSIGNLSAVIAHEIRNPLTGIRTTIQLVQTKLPEDSALTEDLDDTIKELDRIEQFTTDLLQFERPKISELSQANINEVIEKVLSHVALRCSEMGIQVKSELGSDLPEIPLDSDAVRQALLNIVLNALDAMPEGGSLRVTSSTRRYRTRRAVEIAIADTGSGISPQVMEKIYDPFFTTRGTGGTGLGLSISLQIVKEHEGRIYVRNRSQGGVIFRLSFPVPEEIGE
ncbi:MAG: PAS domain-containing protein [Candidatus Eisenbacteria sp.]|nr:PAS domain-containing protein [Candidatus Eisenbacteria bacterium]